MKKLCFAGVVCVLFILFLCLGAFAGTQEVTVKSQPGIPVYGPSPAQLEPGVEGWGTARSSEELTDLDPAWPQIDGAVWITAPAGNGAPPETDTWLWFHDSVPVACTAYNLTGALETAAVEGEEVYLNTVSIGTALDAQLQSFALEPVAEANTLDFVVQGSPATGGQKPPTGVIYKAILSYETPNVQWRPPIAGTHRAIVKNWSTLPIKFKLRQNDGTLIMERQKVYVAVTGPLGDIVRFNELRFSEGNAQYHVNLRTKLYPFQLEVPYTIEVRDACTGLVLGSTPMQIFGKKKIYRHPKH